MRAPLAARRKLAVEQNSPPNVPYVFEHKTYFKIHLPHTRTMAFSYGWDWRSQMALASSDMAATEAIGPRQHDLYGYWDIPKADSLHTQSFRSQEQRVQTELISLRVVLRYYRVKIAGDVAHCT